MEAASARRHVVLIGPIHPYRGGIAHFNETIFHGLAERNNDVTAVTFSRQYPAVLFPGRTQYVDEPADDTVGARRLIDTLNPWTWWSSARAIASRDPDVVIFNYWMGFFAPAFGCIARYLRRRGIRVLAIVHNALSHERRPGDAVLGRFFLGACDGLIVLSDAVADDLERIGVRRPIERINHPIYDLFGDEVPREEARRQLDLSEDAPVILFFGFVRAYKGLRVLLEAMPEIVRQHPELRLVVAGEFYDDEQSYRDFVRRKDLEDSVEFHARYVPEDRVPVYFGAADVVVQPYVSATQSGVAQIAYHFERPLIVTDVGGLPEMVPHERAGFVVPPEDPAALAGAVDRFFAEDWAERLEAGVREERKRFQWEPLFEAIERLSAASQPSPSHE